MTDAPEAAGLARTLRVRWWILVVPSAMYFVSYFHRVAPTVVASDLMRAFAITAGSLATLSAVYPYVFVVMALVAGSLVETLGPRRTLAAGGAAMGLGAVIFGLAPGFGVAVLGRLLVGLGASVILISFLSLAAAWFRPNEFGMIGGLSQTVGNVGGLVASSPLALMVEAIGWRSSFLVIGAVTLLAGAAAMLFVKDRPELAGLAPVNPTRSSPPTLAAVLRGIPDVARNRRTWPPVLACGGIFASLIAFQGLWGVPYLTQVYGLSRVEAAAVTSWLAVGIVVGAPIVGWISDRWLMARRLPMAAFTAAYALCWLPLVVPDLRLPVTWLAPFCLFMGFTSCGLVLVWSCVREVNDPDRVGIAIAFCNVPIFLGFALMQWITGLVLDAHWTGLAAAGLRIYPPAAYRSAFLVCLAVAAGAAAAAAFVTETRCRNLWVAPARRAA
jgi:sugar phosphate permease